MTPSRGRRAGVVMASAAGFGLGLSGLPFYTIGIFAEPLHRTFAWPVAAIQGGLTLLLLSNVATLPVVALLVKRFGARPVALTSIVLFAFSFMSFATLNASLPLFYVHWLLLSMTGAGTLSITWSRAVAALYDDRRGFALGVVMMGSGVTALVAPLSAGYLIQAIGWRWAYVVVGAAPLLLAGPLVALLFWDHTAATVEQPRLSTISGDTLLNLRFWLIGACFLLVGAAVSGALPNLVRLLTERRLPLTEAAGIASLLGLFVILGRLVGGYLMDRIWAPLVAFIFFGGAAAGALALQHPGTPSFAVPVAAAALGFASGLELDMLPYLVGRYFAPARFSSLLAALSGFFFLGSALGPFGFARLRELSGGYSTPLRLDAAAFAIAAAGLLCLGKYRSPLGLCDLAAS